MGRSTLCLSVAFLVVLVAIIAEEFYTDVFDHIKPEDILPNDELRNQYYNCIMDTGPCATEDQKFFRGIPKNIPESDKISQSLILQSECLESISGLPEHI